MLQTVHDRKYGCIYLLLVQFCFVSDIKLFIQLMRYAIVGPLYREVRDLGLNSPLPLLLQTTS